MNTAETILKTVSDKIFDVYSAARIIEHAKKKNIDYIEGAIWMRDEILELLGHDNR